MHNRIGLIFAGILAAQAGFAADDNTAFVEQLGAENTGLIDQVGANNAAGYEADPILQDGFFNQLLLDQFGNSNTVGLSGDGVEQRSNQTNRLIFNSIEIEQSSNNNTVGEIFQDARGSVPNGANELIILQTTGDDNVIGRVLQIQNGGEVGQIATLTQSGTGNILDLVEQRSLSSIQQQPNRIRLNIIGSFNGAIALSGVAQLAGAISSALIQTIGTEELDGNGNVIDLEILGDDNRFGIWQGGRLNSVGLLTITGDQNQLGIRQDGSENDITMSVIEGSGNIIGLDQFGTNRAFVNLIGQSDDNIVYGKQQGTADLEISVEGNLNEILSEQDYHSGTGGDNTASITVVGNENFADLLQRGSNSFALDILGDRNNNNGQALSGDAAVVGLIAGQFRQTGSGNDITGIVIGDANLLAFTQEGAMNVIMATMTGNLNQAAIVQIGDDNYATLNQTGSGNTAGFIQ